MNGEKDFRIVQLSRDEIELQGPAVEGLDRTLRAVDKKIRKSLIPKHKTVTGNTKCMKCQKVIVAHPSHEEFAYLYRLCDGSLAEVKKHPRTRPVLATS